jgi:fucose permease
MTQKSKLSWIAPVLMSFLVMSIIDLVGITVDYVNEDFELSKTIIQLIPLVTFSWFFLLSVPVGILQSKIGKRVVLNIGMIITALGLLIPFFLYSFEMVLVGFVLLGIGNTIIQVSANPLLVDVVPGNRASSYLSFSQFVKAIGSMSGPPLAAFLAGQFGDWKLMFIVFGVVTIISIIWLGAVKIQETKSDEVKVSLASSFKLLGTGYILVMVMAIFLVVGIDVGFNSNSGQFLIDRYGMDLQQASYGRSVYFFGRLLGTFAGAFILLKVSSRKVLLLSALAGILTFVALLLIKSEAMSWVLMFLSGLSIATIFPIVFALSVEKFPTRSNEISGLIMMAISGGAIIPVLIGVVADATSSMTIGMTVLIACWFYMLFTAFYAMKKDKSA